MWILKRKRRREVEGGRWRYREGEREVKGEGALAPHPILFVSPVLLLHPFLYCNVLSPFILPPIPARSDPNHPLRPP
eukprot:2546088-Pyramimonas_sp.AAC.1